LHTSVVIIIITLGSKLELGIEIGIGNYFDNHN